MEHKGVGGLLSLEVCQSVKSLQITATNRSLPMKTTKTDTLLTLVSNISNIRGAFELPPQDRLHDQCLRDICCSGNDSRPGLAATESGFAARRGLFCPTSGGAR